jgi:hypothetical protein
MWPKMQLPSEKLKRAKRRRNLRVHFVTVQVLLCGISTVHDDVLACDNAAPGELSQSTALAISIGVPMRPTGVCVAIVFDGLL